MLLISLLSFSALFVILSSVRTVSASPDLHAPIYIVGNENFTPTNGVRGGSGTETDPYIIENWEINASTAGGIYIKNTAAYFVIRNVLVENGGHSVSVTNITPNICNDNLGYR
ncbi:MAG: hypothetical protein QW623_04640 [Candidatus Hadarchaeales archaeon]